MFATFNQRPHTTRAIRVTTRNYQQVADYIRATIADTRGVDVTPPSARVGHRAYLKFTARTAAPYSARVTVPIPGYLTINGPDSAPRYQGHAPDMFTAQYAPDPTDPDHTGGDRIHHGLDPDHTPTTRVTTAVQALADAALPLAAMFGPHNPNHPDDYVTNHGLLVRALVGNRVRVDHTRPTNPDTAALLVQAADALTAAAFTTQHHADAAPYLVAQAPDTD